MIVIGEALIDLVAAADGRFDAHEGGAARNVALAASRLGAAVTFVAGFSADGFGQQLRATLIDNGVDVSRAPVTRRPTPLAVARLDNDGQASYSFHLAETAALSLTEASIDGAAPGELLHISLGAITLATPSVGEALQAKLASHEALTSLDPNVRPAFITTPAEDAARLDTAASGCDLLRCSDEDIALLYGKRAIADVAFGWLDGGATAVVVTRGADGAELFTSSLELRVPAWPVQVADTVGAGDTFGAALLTHLDQRDVRTSMELRKLTEADWTEALTFAARAAGITSSRPGADPPWRDEL